MLWCLGERSRRAQPLPGSSLTFFLEGGGWGGNPEMKIFQAGHDGAFMPVIPAPEADAGVWWIYCLPKLQNGFQECPAAYTQSQKQK